MKSLTNINFDKSIRKAEYAAVLFFADRCGPSRMASEGFKSISKTRKNITFFTVNVDNEERLAKRCGVEILPAILFFERGEPIAASYGVSGQKSLESLMDRLIK